EYYAWVNGVTSNFTGAVLVAGNGTEAVRMARDQQAIGFAPAPTEDLAGLLVDAFKPTDPADIPKLSVPKKDFSVEAPAQDADDDEEFTFTYEEDRDEVDPATRLRNLMQAKREAIYQIYTAKRSGGTSRKRVRPYAVVDIIDEGRVVTCVAESRAEAMIQCRPARRGHLVTLPTWSRCSPRRTPRWAEPVGRERPPRPVVRMRRPLWFEDGSSSERCLAADAELAGEPC